MRRRAVLMAVGTTTVGGFAGCLNWTRSQPRSRGDGTDTPDDGGAAGLWPQIGYDAGNTRHSTTARGPRDGALVAWTSLGDRRLNPPVVGEAIYLNDGPWIGGATLAVSKESGTMKWSNSALSPMRWAPALHENRMLVVTRGDVDRLHAFETSTGDRIWVREEGITASVGDLSSVIGPAVRTGSVYLASSRGVIACSAATGDIKWTAPLGGPAANADDGSQRRADWAMPAVTDERVLTFDANDRRHQTRTVYAIDRATGDRAWTAELEVPDGWSLRGYPVVGSDRAFVSALDPHETDMTGDSEWSGTEQLFALDVATGNVEWTLELTGKTLGRPAYADSTLYVGEWHPDTDTGRLHAVDATDGGIRWTYHTEAGGVRSPTVASDTAYVVQGDEIAGVSIADGTRRWRLKTDFSLGPPVVSGNRLYIYTNPTIDANSHLLAIREP